MNGLDLFSGIGGITKALEGYVRPVAYCENDRYAQAVLLSRQASGQLPVAPIWDDVRTLRGDMLPSVDFLYGGFPCQDISVAGRGAGLEGKRSGLFFEIIRLVSEIRPRFVFLENVPAIRLRGGNIVAGELARLGYDCRWDLLSASDVGANHQRERWWLLAYAKSEQNRRVQLYRLQSDSRASGKDVADAAGSGRRERNQDAGWLCQRARTPKKWSGSPNDGWWKVEPPVGRVANGIPKRVDRLRALGNAVVPAQAREAFERLMGLK